MAPIEPGLSGAWTTSTSTGAESSETSVTEAPLRVFLRRIERRMQVLELRNIDDYVERLRADHQEVIQLFHDVLIG